MTDSQTPEQQAEFLKQAADAAAAAQVEKLKKNLVQSIAGIPQEEAPKSWSALKEETAEMAVSKAEQRILSKLEAQKKAEDDRVASEVKQTATQRETALKQEHADLSAQWREAVSDGLLPDVSEDVKVKLVAGSPLSEKDFEDPGLKVWNDVRALHVKLRSEGKSTSLYRTAQKFYNKQPAGASAPVLGGSVAVSPTSGYSYDEIHKASQQKYRHK